MTADELRRTFLFEAFSDEQLRWLMANADEVSLPAGERLLTEGQAGDVLWVLLEGQWRFWRTVGGRELTTETAETPGTWGGWLPMFEDASPISAETLLPSRMVRIPKEAVRHMLSAGFPVTTHLLAGITFGIQNFEAMTRQQEKLAALGKLSAGLAHELNNPAAAARRAAGRLREALRERDERALALGRRLEPAQAAALLGLAQASTARAGAAELDPLARSDREDALALWLDERGVADAFDLAPALVEAGLGTDELAPVAGQISAEALPDALAWLGAAVGAAGLAGEVEQSVGRISELVGAIKDYSYMDRTAEQEVDVHRGIEDTLKILAFKARGVAVTREFAPDLPRVCAHGSELNQVWTNLLDNAIDAVKTGAAGEPRIAIRTALEDDEVLVEIADNGPGIPAELHSRVFEPFFTTKPVGEGTGLGLDVSYRIVVRQHGGDLSFASEPGETRFRVRLPVDENCGPGDAGGVAGPTATSARVIG